MHQMKMRDIYLIDATEEKIKIMPMEQVKFYRLQEIQLNLSKWASPVRPTTMEEPLTLREVANLTRGTMRMVGTKQINQNQTMMMKFFDWEAEVYAQWIKDNDLQFMHSKGMTQTLWDYKVLWNIWKNAVTRDYETLVVIEDTSKNPGGGASYIASTKRAFSQMYGGIAQENTLQSPNN